MKSLTAFVVIALLAAGLGVVVAYGLPDDDNPRVCISAIGPVDAQGHGDTTPSTVGDCP